MVLIDELARVEIGRICQRGGDIKQLKKLIRANPNIVYANQQTVKWIRMAAWNGHIDPLRIICQSDVNSALSSTRFHQPIIASARYGHYQCTKLLLKSMRVDKSGRFYSNLTLIKLLRIACQDVIPQLVSIVLGYRSVLLYLQHEAYNVWDDIDDYDEEVTVRDWLRDPPDYELLCGRGESGLEVLNDVWDAQMMFNETIGEFDPVSIDKLTQFFEKFDTFIDIPADYISIPSCANPEE